MSEVLANAYNVVYIGILLFISVLLFLCLIRAIKGPRLADRIVAVNMMGTMVIVMIAVLAVMYQETYLIDICLIYAMISFLAVIVISKVYIGVVKEEKEGKEKKEIEGNGES